MRRFFLPLLSLAATAFAADAPLAVDPRELPHFPPVEPADAPATFQVRRGFHVELVAAEPLVESPVAICFDENERMFVAEMRDYSEQRDASPHLGRIRLVLDEGHDCCERATVFADDLPWPTALIWANGGLFVAAAPDIWFFKDTDGDGRADVRERVFTGFASGNAKLNVQSLPNCFAWGPDNRIHLQSGVGNRGMIRCLKRGDLPAQELGGRDFWFDPRTLEFGFETGGGQYGMSFDNAGRRFVCNNSDHLRTFVFDDRYAARNPFLTLPQSLASVAADGPAAAVFRISPDEPWRVIRTRWRASGKVPGIVEGGGRVSGYFTGATGTTVYRGDALGAEFVGNTFTGDAGGNLVHRKIIRHDGASVIGERPADERAVEFLASRDTWFRPVNFANAPDGTLYIVDMYREVIEHPWSIPEPIKSQLDLTSGRERGRIWRIAPDGFAPRYTRILGSASIGELVAALSDPIGWRRDAATRLLCERNDPAATAPLEQLLAEGKAPLGRLHALRALDGIGALNDATLALALGDADDAVREHAVRLCEKAAHAGKLNAELWEKLRVLGNDASPRVRLQLAFSLGEFSNDGVVPLLARMAQRDAADPWIAPAIRSGAPPRMALLFAELSRDGAFAKTNAGRAFLASLATGIGSRNVASEVDAVFAFAAENHEPELLAALGVGLQRSGAKLASGARAEALRESFAEARKVLADSDAAVEQRATAARLLGFEASAESRAVLIDALAVPALQMTALQALGRDGASAMELVQRWNSLDEPVRRELGRTFTANPARATMFMDAVRSGTIPAEKVPTEVAAQLRSSRDESVAGAARKLWPAPAIETRDAVIARFSAALELSGDRKKGREIFLQRCATCHRIAGEGTALGPDLESVSGGGKEKLLTHILDPNREVAPQFASYEAELSDGSVLAGVLASDSPGEVVIREPGGRETSVPRSKLVRLQTTGRSPMPEGLEAGLTPQDFANLLEFVAKPRE